MNNKLKKITIVGTGLIGSSIGLALKKKKISKFVVGIDKSKRNLTYAIKNKSIDEARLKIDSRIADSDIIFLCIPVSQINQTIEKLSVYIKKECIITDVGSVKNCFSKNIIKLASNLFYLVPGHPVAGTEFSGSKYAQHDLFEGKWCILTPINNNKYPLNIVSKIWKQIGMKISVMSIEDHDKIMSVTSHLPHFIAFTIVGTAFKMDLKKKKELINFSAGGFRDFTRIGSSDSRMWTDIFLTNKKFILKTLDNFLSDIKNLQKLIKKDESEKIFNLLKKTKQIRKKILLQEKKK